MVNGKSTPLLFGDIAGKDLAIKNKTGKSDGSVARLMDVYREEFRRKWNAFDRDGALVGPEVKPLINYGRDSKHLKDLAAAWGEDEVAALIREFFASKDPRVVRRDYKISVLYELAQTIRIGRLNGQARDERTEANIDAAQRAMKPTTTTRR